MKKFFACVMLFTVFLLSGCNKDDGQVDLSKSSASKYNEEELYGKVIHVATVAKKVVVKNIKFSDSTYAYSIGIQNDKFKSMVALVCDLRANGAAVTYSIVNDEGFVPKGDVELSIMKYREGVTDIREVDDDQDPVFSTANGDRDFLTGIRKAASLPGDTVLAFVIDKEGASGNYEGIAWSPLFTAKQLDKAMSNVKDNCGNLKLDLEDLHMVAAAEK